MKTLPRLSTRMRRTTLLLLTGSVLAACTPLQSYQAPTPDAPASFDEAKSTSAAVADRQWWTAFRDDRLNALVAKGLSQNLDVRLAVERIEEAKANAGLAASADLPQSGAGIFEGRSDPTGAATVSVQSVSGQVSWAIDLFGRNASGKAASKARLDAAYASADLSRILIAGSIAEAYIDLRYFQNRIDLTRQSRASRTTTSDLIQKSFDAGSATKLDLLRADQLIALADAQLPGLEIGYRMALNRLATLTGQPTSVLEVELRKGAGQPAPRFKASVGVPVEVLRKRPDIIIAERNYAAAVAAVGIAKADLLPSLSLGGTILSNSIQGVPGTTETWSFGPTLSLPLFNGGRLKANLSAAESRARQAQLGWQSAVLKAVEEVQNALAAYSRDGRNMAAQERLMSISQQTLDLARSSFEIGEADFLSVLEAERTLLDARGAMAEASRARALNFVRLSMATADGVTAP